MNIDVDRQIAASKAKIAKLEFDLAVEQAILERFQSMADWQAPKTSPPSEHRDRAAVATRKPSASMRPGSWAAKAFDILKASGKPLHIRKIASALEQQGEKTDAKHGLKPLLVSALTRSTVFVRTGVGVYGLAEWSGQQKA